MKIEATPLAGAFVITPKVWRDERGFFIETYKENVFREAGLVTEWKQDNWSRSAKGVLRGLHFQRDPKAQAKLVRVIRGSVYDVIVDIRPDSPTRGRSFGLELSADNQKALYVPAGFAHGFQALEDETDLTYKCSDLYAPECEGGYRWDDPAFGIEWPLASPKLSPKDLVYPLFK